MRRTAEVLGNAPRPSALLNRSPDIPRTHFVDHRIYNDPDIFRLETETIFAKTWKFVCHVSEIPNPLDFRTTTVAGVPLLVLRNEREELKCFAKRWPSTTSIRRVSADCMQSRTTRIASS